MATATLGFTVTVNPVLTDTEPFSVTILGAAATATLGFSVTVLTSATLNVDADKTSVVADETVTLTGSGGTITTWAADNGATLTGSGATRELIAPAYIDTTVVRVTITGPGGSDFVDITVKGQPSIYRSSSWVPTRVRKFDPASGGFGFGLFGEGPFGE
jgi:hypothetical protein